MGRGTAHLSTWVDAETKHRFSAVASRQCLSDSALLKRLIEQLLALAPADTLTVHPEPSLRDARLTIRLRADDRMLLRERAAARGMPAATYLSVLARAHLRALAPLPDRELGLLAHTASELQAIGRRLNGMARTSPQAVPQAAATREDLRALLSVCQVLRDHIRALVRTNALSWEAGRASQ